MIVNTFSGLQPNSIAGNVCIGCNSDIAFFVHKRNIAFCLQCSLETNAVFLACLVIGDSDIALHRLAILDGNIQGIPRSIAISQSNAAIFTCQGNIVQLVILAVQIKVAFSIGCQIIRNDGTCCINIGFFVNDSNCASSLQPVSYLNFI